MPDEPARADTLPPPPEGEATAPVPRAAEPEPAPDAQVLRFGPGRQRALLALLGGLVAVAVAVPVGDQVRRVLALVAALGLIAFAVRDLVNPVRLVAGPNGLTVARGLIGYRRVFWFEVERIRVDRRARLGLTTRMLEIDLGENLYLFSASDLGVAPETAAEAVGRMQPERFRSG